MSIKNILLIRLIVIYIFTFTVIVVISFFLTIFKEIPGNIILNLSALAQIGILLEALLTYRNVKNNLNNKNIHRLGMNILKIYAYINVWIKIFEDSEANGCVSIKLFKKLALKYDNHMKFYKNEHLQLEQTIYQVMLLTPKQSTIYRVIRLITSMQIANNDDLICAKNAYQIAIQLTELRSSMIRYVISNNKQYNSLGGDNKKYDSSDTDNDITEAFWHEQKNNINKYKDNQNKLLNLIEKINSYLPDELKCPSDLFDLHLKDNNANTSSFGHI